MVCSIAPDAPPSVHLADFPSPNESRSDEALRTAVQATRTVVTLGQRVRAERKLKIRQPLQEAIVVVVDDQDKETFGRFGDAVREELNVRTLSFTQEPERYVTFDLVPNFRVLGPRLGKQMKECKKALQEADGSALYSQMEEAGYIQINLSQGPIHLSPQEVEVRLKAKEDYAASAEGGRVVVLDIKVTDELRREGLAREVINRIQRARKAMDLPYETRIQVQYQTQGELSQAMVEHGQDIAGETLSTAFDPIDPGDDPSGERHEAKVEGTALTFWITTL
jgi:isoleucyl-tRNA synthetase